MKAGVSIGMAVILGLAASDAQAEDPRSDALTVLPFTGTSVAFSADKEKRGVIGVDHRFRQGVRLSLEASAPLDEDTREAAFLDGNQLAGGINLDAQIGFDSTYRALDLSEQERMLLDLSLCNEVNEAPRTAPPAAPARPASGQQPGEPRREVVEQEIPTCTPERIAAWGSAHADRPEWVRYQAALGAKGAARREATVRIIPAQPATHYALGADVSASYDLASIYKEDLAAAPVELSKYDMQAGVRGTLYLVGQLALTLRAGGDIAKGFTATKVQRCADVPSGAASVRGQACRDVLFLRNADDAPKASAYTRLSLTYVPLALIGGGVPGFELRGGLEQIGQTPRFNLRATGFFSPEVGVFAGRFGVGLDLVDHLASDAVADVRRGQIDVTPFIFVGVTPVDLN